MLKKGPDNFTSTANHPINGSEVVTICVIAPLFAGSRRAMLLPGLFPFMKSVMTGDGYLHKAKAGPCTCLAV